MRLATLFPDSFLRCVGFSCILASTAACGTASVDSSNFASLAGRSLTLADARRLAFQRNWDLLAAKSDVGIAVAQRIVAREFPNPAASFSVEKINADRHSSGTASGNGFWDRSYDTTAAVDQLIEIGGAGADAEARKARVALEVLLGDKEPRGEIELADGLDSLGNVSTEATNAPPATFSRPDLVAAEAARVKAEADLRLQKAARIPDPTLLAQYEHEPPDQPNTVGFGVSFQLPLWNRNGGNIAAARATLEQTTTRAEKVRTQVMADIAVARVSHLAALTRWQRYRDELTPKSG